MAALPPPGRTGNRLLDRLSPADYARLTPDLEAITLAGKQDLYHIEDPLRYVYFPQSGVLSLGLVLEDGREIEVASVGNEGMLGIGSILGLDSIPYQVTCQVPGHGWRLPVRPFLDSLRRSSRFDHLARRYTAVFLRQATQLVACNALHSVRERLCRWLLMAHDRARADEFALTHQFLAEMLGVRRPTVSDVAAGLQAAGLVRYRRGILRVLDRRGLERAACECYGAMTTFYQRTLAG
jgi:CRP-like cAMP-binding protein